MLCFETNGHLDLLRYKTKGFVKIQGKVSTDRDFERSASVLL